MKYSVIELSGQIRETGKLTKSISGGRRKNFRLDQFRSRIEEIVDGKSPCRIIVDCKSDFHPVVFAGLAVVREGLERLVKAGKELYFFGRDYSGVQLYLASVCKYRYINLCGNISFLGLSRTFSFLKGALDKHGVEVQVFRRGKFKSANDSFRVKKLDPANREQWETFYQCLDTELKEKILSGYDRDEADFEELKNGRILSSEEAVSDRWVNEILTVGELEARWKKEKIKKKKKGHDRTSWGSGSGIAVLHFEGGILEGRSRQDPLMGQIIGSDTFLGEIKRLKKSRKVKGVVLRVNCPGGSPVASDEVSRGLEELAAEKPLAVSMGDVAGSGGYWISTVGRKVFTEKTTVTGSIGVVAMLVQAGKLMKEWGVNQEAIKTGPMADLGSYGRPMTPGEKNIMDGMIESLYFIFLKRVAGFRDKSVDEIDEIAQGRIWSGEEAVKIGLADEIGGLAEAVDFIKDELGAKKVRVNHYPEIKSSFLEKQLSKANPAAGVLQKLSAFSAMSAVSGRPLLFMPELFGEFSDL